MEVIKRNGQKEEISFDKIKNRLNQMAIKKPALNNVDIAMITQKVIARIYDNIKTGELVFINAGHESILSFDQNKNYEYIKSEMPPIGIVKYFSESMVKSNTINIKDKTLVVYTDGVTEGYLENGEELGAEGVQKIINKISEVTPKNIVDSIEKELNWGADKLRDDITCMAINIENTDLVKKTKQKS